MERIKAAGYTALMPYSSATMTLDADGIQPRTIECLKRGLDYMHASGLKVIFCLKEQLQNGIMEFDGVKGRIELSEHIVRHFKRHPAILFWYITDENPLHEIPNAIDFRHRISAIDPFHPVLTCTDVFRNQFHFAQTGDVLNPDCYPIEKKGPHSMAKIRSHLTQDTGLPLFFAAQAFNWGAFAAEGEYELFSYPTAEEMRSMGLLALNGGARGLTYFSYTTALIRHEMFDSGSFTWFWPQVVSVVQFMREMGPFFTTTTPAQPLEVTPDGKNFVEAKLHRNGDRVCVIVTADGPGAAKATFRLPDGLNLKPRFGHTVKNADGSFTFTGTDICSDVLE